MIQIKSEKISLIALNKNNKKEAMKLFSPNVTRWLEPISSGKKKDIEKWLKSMMPSVDRYTFLIEDESSKIFIGMIWIERIHKINLSGDMGFLIGEEFQGKGYALRASKLLIDYSFNKLKLRKITALTNNYNTPSQKLIAKLGFKLEGQIRKDYTEKSTGRWCDVLMYGLFKNEWKL